MSNYSKSSTALKKESLNHEEAKPELAKIIRFPDLRKLEEKKEKKKRVHLDPKFLYYKGKKIPILQFQKSGYDKLLKLLVKEIER